MATKLGDNISYGGLKPNFERDLFPSLAEARQYSGELLDEGHISYMVAEQKHYKWNGAEWKPLTSDLKHYREGDRAASIGSEGMTKSVIITTSDGDTASHLTLDSESLDLFFASENGVKFELDKEGIVEILSDYGNITINENGIELSSTIGVTINDSVTLPDAYRIILGGNISMADTIHALVDNLIVSNLTSDSNDMALSAAMGKELNETKQDNLVSGENIKTINGSSILGSGDIIIEGGEGGGTSVEIVNDLATGGATAALSAEMGKELNDAIQEQNGKLAELLNKEWIGTQAEYDALETIDDNTTYYITE